MEVDAVEFNWVGRDGLALGLISLVLVLYEVEEVHVVGCSEHLLRGLSLLAQLNLCMLLVLIDKRLWRHGLVEMVHDLQLTRDHHLRLIWFCAGALQVLSRLLKVEAERAFDHYGWLVFLRLNFALVIDCTLLKEHLIRIERVTDEARSARRNIFLSR